MSRSPKSSGNNNLPIGSADPIGAEKAGGSDRIPFFFEPLRRKSRWLVLFAEELTKQFLP